MRTFTITDEQQAKARAWRGNHLVGGKMCGLRPGSVGDLEHYTICPTAIGDFITIVCACGESLDLNDYESF